SYRFGDPTPHSVSYPAVFRSLRDLAGPHRGVERLRPGGSHPYPGLAGTRLRGRQFRHPQRLGTAGFGEGGGPHHLVVHAGQPGSSSSVEVKRGNRMELMSNYPGTFRFTCSLSVYSPSLTSTGGRGAGY